MIRTRDRENVRSITLDRPNRRNALRPDDLDALRDAVVDAPTPVVYIHGAGEAFSAGADLDVVADLDDPAAFVEHGQAVMDAIESADSAVVAGVDGAARGGGVELALACDLRVATPDATFSESGIRLGLYGAWGGTVRLPRILGHADAFDLALTGRVVDAEEAHRMGLVSRVVPNPETVAEELASVPADALGLVRQRLRDQSDVDAQYRAEASAFAQLHETHVSDIADQRRGD